MDKYELKIPNNKGNLFKSLDGRAILTLAPFPDLTQGRNIQKGDSNNTKADYYKTASEFPLGKIFKNLPSDAQMNKKQKSKKDIKIAVLEERIKVKETSIKHLQTQISSSSFKKMHQEDNPTPPIVFEKLNFLLIDLEKYILADITADEDIPHARIKILNSMNSIQETLSFIKENYECIYQKDKLIKSLKGELEEFKVKEKNMKLKIDELKNEITLLKEQNLEIQKGKKIERVKKVIEVSGDVPLCRENNDLRRRLELACMFLLSKKEKIAKLNEKNEFLNKRINDIVKAKTFSENEEQQIREILSKKMKYLTSPDKVQIDFNKKTIDFRVERLKEKYRDLINEIIESGTEEFCKHFTLMDVLEREKLCHFITDQLLSYMEFSTRLNKILSFLHEAFNYNKEQLILHVRLNFIDVLDAERVTLWVYDNQSNEFYTYSNNQKYTLPFTEPFLSKVVSEGIINRYKNTTNENNSNFYSPNLENIFSHFNVRSILAIPVIDYSTNQIYGIIEAVNSHHLIFSSDEEYLITNLSRFIQWFLIKFSIEEAENKHSRKDQIFPSIIKIMNQKNLFELTKAFEEESTILLEAYSVKLLFLHQEYLLYYNHEENYLRYYVKGGIAGKSLKSSTGIYVKFPKDDEFYNLNIDIECHSSNVCFYSIPLFKDGLAYAILQFTIEKDENNNNQYKNISSHQISKLDYYKEKIIEILNIALSSASSNFVHKDNDS